MMVYIVKPNATACGGCAIVAAPTANKAVALVKANNDIYEHFDIDLYATRVVHLESDYEQPRVICDAIYVE